MGKIYKLQTKLNIVLCVGQDITGATTTKIKYKKPSGAAGELTATIKDAKNGEIEYVVPALSTLLDEVGTWSLWAHVVFSDGRIANGQLGYFVVNDEGEI